MGFAYDVVLAALLLLPPTILMGGTIPMLTQALSRSLEDATRFHAFVYAFNTAGAVVGALAAGFVLVPWLGLRKVMFAMGAINLVAGGVFLLLAARGAGATLPAAVPEAGPRARPAGFAVYVLAALLTGFAMMAIQTVLIRIAGLAFGSSQFTFSMVVAVFVLSIALGSFAVAALPRIPRGLLLLDFALLVSLLYLLHSVLGVAPFWAHVLRIVFSLSNLAFYPYYAAAFLGILLLVGPAVVLSGAVLPLLFHHLRDRVSDLGAVAGSLYGWNTVGSLLGALLGGYVLLFWLDLDQVYRLAIAALAVAGCVLFVNLYGVSRLAGAAVLGGVLGALWLSPTWDPRQLSIGLFRFRQQLPVQRYDPVSIDEHMNRGTTIRFYDDDPTASIAVWELSRKGSDQPVLAIINNGKSDGSTLSDYPTMGLAALLPALMADRLENAFVVGYGTGVTVGELAALRSTRRVDVAEISPGVVKAAPLFDPFNQGATRSPKVRIVQSDAYRALLRSDARYDAIVSEPSNPWVTGVEMLYSREFLEAARSRLTPGGLYVQWCHQYETDSASLSLILRTYAEVFDEFAIWYGAGPDLLLLGFAGPTHELDLRRIEARAASPDVAAGLRRAGVPGIPELLAHELVPAGVVHALRLQGPVHTLLHPRLADSAGRAFFRGGEGELPFTGYGEPARVGERNALLNHYARRFGGVLPDAAYGRLAEEACTHRTDRCAAILADWGLRHPGSASLPRAVAAARNGGTFGGPLDLEDVAQIRTVLSGGPSIPAEVQLAAARASTSAFRRYYQHGLAFDASRVQEIWQRCRGPAEACAEGREAAIRLLDGGGAELAENRAAGR